MAFMSRAWCLQPKYMGISDGDLDAIMRDLSKLWPYHTYQTLKEARRTCSVRKNSFVNDSCWPYKCVNEKNQGDTLSYLQFSRSECVVAY